MRQRKPIRSPFVVTAALTILGAGCGSRIESTPGDGGVDGPGPGCPESLPERGGACVGTTTCSYNPCHTQVATCTGGRWELMEGSCNPPPPSCPAKLPAVGDPCGPSGVGFGGCAWADPCSPTPATITMYCDGAGWRASGTPLPTAKCPPTLPAEESSCAECVGRWPARCEYVATTAGGLAYPKFAACDPKAKVWHHSVPVDAGAPADATPAEAGPSSDAGPP